MTIAELLNAKEGENVEFKEAKNAFEFDTLVKYACAVSNYGGGRVVFGITDKRPRKIVGSLAFEQPERTRKGLIDRLHINVDFTELTDDAGHRVLVFIVPSRPIGQVVQNSKDGIAWWRIGDSLVPMPDEVRRRIYEEGGHDFSADICQGATLADLDKDAIENFRQRWFQRSGLKRLQTLSDKQLLMDCDAITNDGVTYAALILMGTHKSLTKYLAQAEIVFEYRPNMASGPAAQREDFREPFFTVFDRLWELVNLRNTKQHYQDMFFVLPIDTFNERTCREALLNAVSHRDYHCAGSIFIRQYPDRLVIESPGGFPPGISADNCVEKQNPRNRRIAELFAKCGLVERSGQGMNLIYENSVREGKRLPDWKGTDNYDVKMTLNGTILEKRFLTFQRRIPEEQYDLLSSEDFLALYYVWQQQKLPVELKNNAKALCEQGLLAKLGRGKYRLPDLYQNLPSQDGVASRPILKTDEECKADILNFIREHTEAGVSLKELLAIVPSREERQVRYLLRVMKKNGLIEVNGHGNSARWHISIVS